VGSLFGARRVRGKRGHGASGKTIVFGIFKRSAHALRKARKVYDVERVLDPS